MEHYFRLSFLPPMVSPVRNINVCECLCAERAPIGIHSCKLRRSSLSILYLTNCVRTTDASKSSQTPTGTHYQTKPHVQVCSSTSPSTCHRHSPSPPFPPFSTRAQRSPKSLSSTKNTTAPRGFLQASPNSCLRQKGGRRSAWMTKREKRGTRPRRCLTAFLRISPTGLLVKI